MEGEKVEIVTDFLFLGSKITGWWLQPLNLKTSASWQESYDKPRPHVKKQISLCDKGLYSQSYAFSSSHVQMWELDHKEGWVIKNWCSQTVVLEKTLRSPLDSKEIKPVNPKGNIHWIFTGRTDPEAEDSIPWPPEVKSQLTRKDPDAGKDWEKWEGDEMRMRWHHWLNGHEFEPTLGYGVGQGNLVCCSSWGHKESDTTEQLSSKLKIYLTCNVQKPWEGLKYYHI